jgi:phosphocarrier protein FPr
MIGIVVVSHSEQLARGVLELASQMTRGAVAMEAAGGIDDPDNPIGTDPMRVLAAIEAVAGQVEDGVLVLMDLGSALMSAETALDFLEEAVKAKVRLCAAPLVEGTVAAAVQASVGASLAEAAAEAEAALDAKIHQLAPVTGQTLPSPAPDEAPAPPPAGEEQSLELTIANPLGLHARPAANLVTTAGRFRATVTVRKGQASASAKSINQLALLAVKQGDTITITATGPDAGQALAALAALHADHFGERDSEVDETLAAAPTPQPAGDGVLVGAPASTGQAVGPAHVHRPGLPEVVRRETNDPAREINRLDAALATAQAELEQLSRDTVRTSGKAVAAIFEVHALLLGDKDLRQAAAARIDAEKVEAPYAWNTVVEETAAAYRRLSDGYMQARAADVLDCGGRVLRLLAGEVAAPIGLAGPSILVVRELSPSEAAGLDPALVLGIVTETGGATSHAAILARSLGIPAVIGVGEKLRSVAQGQMLVLDGQAGLVLTAPDAAACQSAREQRQAWLAAREQARSKGSAPAVTRDGLAVPVMANIGSPADAAKALAAGADGVGLFRTEFLFLGREAAPSEDEQYEAYVAAAQAMEGRPVIIRTLDIGGDKPVPYLNLPKEDNPFLGLRGVRLCLARLELFRTQLRALLRAAAGRNIRIMYPMISDIRELAEVLAMQARERETLVGEGREVAPKVATGIMIEVPAAVAMADRLAGRCDFFSIGTNDLTQYAMAADRGNPAVAGLCDSLNPAVLRLIARTCQAGAAAGIEVGMCGELAGNAAAAPLLLGLGLKELSMSAGLTAEVKEAVRAVGLEECRALAAKALAADSAGMVRELLG